MKQGVAVKLPHYPGVTDMKRNLEVILKVNDWRDLSIDDWKQRQDILDDVIENIRDAVKKAVNDGEEKHNIVLNVGVFDEDGEYV